MPRWPWLLGAVALLGVAVWGALTLFGVAGLLAFLSLFGAEARDAPAPAGALALWFVALVALPGAGALACLYQAFRRPAP